MLFLGRLCLRRRERVCVEQVPAVRACYCARLAAGKTLVCQLFILLISCEKEECDSFVVPSYRRQFRRGIGQQRPLLPSYEILRSYGILRPRVPAYYKNVIVGAER